MHKGNIIFLRGNTTQLGFVSLNSSRDLRLASVGSYLACAQMSNRDEKHKAATNNVFFMCLILDKLLHTDHKFTQK